MSLPSIHFPSSTSTIGKRKLLEESDDEELFTVPDIDVTSVEATKTRGVDKEHRRLIRLLRSRVSSQQERETKKIYINNMESKANELQEKILKLEEKISILINENTMLRKILMNTITKAFDNKEAKRVHKLSNWHP